MTSSLLVPLTFLFISTYLASFLGNDLHLMTILSLSHPITCLSIMEMHFFVHFIFSWINFYFLYIKMKNFLLFELHSFLFLFDASFLPFGCRTIATSWKCKQIYYNQKNVITLVRWWGIYITHFSLKTLQLSRFSVTIALGVVFFLWWI